MKMDALGSLPCRKEQQDKNGGMDSLERIGGCVPCSGNVCGR